MVFHMQLKETNHNKDEGNFPQMTCSKGTMDHENTGKTKNFFKKNIRKEE